MLAPRNSSSFARRNAFGRTRFGRFAVGKLAVALAVAAVVGCDDVGSTDKTTAEKVDKAVAAINGLPSLAPGEGVATVTQGLTSAADGASAGPMKAVAAGAAASVDQQAAYAGVLKIKANEANVRRTLLDLARLTGQVTTSTAYAGGYLKADPKPAIADLSSHISSMQGNAQNPTWGGGEKPTVPTLAAIKQETARLEAELEQKSQQLADLTKKRTDTLATAEAQLNHANSLKGEESVRAFGDAATSKQAADDLAINMDLVQVQIDRLKSDLSLNRGQAGLIDTGVASLKEQGKMLEADWVGVQKAAARQKAIATAAVEGDEQTKQSIKSTLATLNTQLGELATLRSTVLEQLNEAKKYADLGVGEAGKFAATVTPRLTQPGKDADNWKALVTTVSQARYQYRAGVVQRDRGALAVAESALLGDVKATVDGARAAIDAAGLTAPAELAAIDTSVGEQLAKSAEEDLAGSADVLTQVESGNAAKELKDAAKTARLVTLFAHIQLFGLRQAAGDTSAQALATQMTSDALALKGELVAANVPLPALPGELGDATPPTTEPAAAPAAQ